MYRDLRLLRGGGRRLTRARERGSVSLWLVVFTLTAFVLLAFIVDGGQYMNARERAADIAEQAARAGADQVSVASLRGGRQLTIPQGAACTAAGTLVSTYASGALSGKDQAGTQMGPCSVSYPLVNNVQTPTVTVNVSVTVTPALPIIFGSFQTGATESASLDCGNATAQTGAC